MTQLENPRGFYKSVKYDIPLDQEVLRDRFLAVSRERVEAMSADLSEYMTENIPESIRRRTGLAGHRVSPYVLMTTASTMHLSDPRDLANFLVNLKLYMGLETSFGKSIESIVMGHYPIGGDNRWESAPEADAEFAALEGMSNEEKASARVDSSWREVDRVCLHGSRRQILTIKSGPSTINDTQVAGMATAISEHSSTWLESSREKFPDSDGIDVVVGLTYGTAKSTNNKENQILVKLIGNGFHELDRDKSPGVLVNDGGDIQVYRKIGIDYWSYVGSPTNPETATHVYIEVLLALALALKKMSEGGPVEAALNEQLDSLAAAIQAIKIPEATLPDWIGEELSASDLTHLWAALSVYHDVVS